MHVSHVSKAGKSLKCLRGTDRGMELVWLSRALYNQVCVPGAHWLTFSVTTSISTATACIWSNKSSRYRQWNLVSCPFWSFAMISSLKVFHWGRRQPPTASESGSSGVRECMCVCECSTLVPLSGGYSLHHLTKTRTDCHFVPRKAWGALLKTPVGDLSVCNVFWPWELFISASVTSALSLSRSQLLPSGAILADTTVSPLPSYHTLI